MSLPLRYSTLMRECLCRIPSRNYCLQSVSSHSRVIADQLMKCAILSETFVILPKLQQRNFSAKQYNPCQSSTLTCKLETTRFRHSSHNHVNTKVSCRSLSGTPKDEVTSSHQVRKGMRSPCLSDTGATVEASALSLPPAESIEELRDKHKRLRKTKKNRSVLRPELARLMVDKVWPDGSLAEEKAVIIETSPGPGILTRHLLNSGAPKVIAMEREKPFLPSLGVLASKAGRRLRVMHADFFAMHYHGSKDVQPPIVRIAKVFDGIEPVPWEADIQIKIIGSLPHHNERTHAYIIASQLLERLSSFKYGRVQFNVLMSEGCYNVISQPVGNMSKYRALSALMQMSCDIELLHMEPQVSFRLPTPSGESSKVDFSDKDLSLCLVRLTPKRDLFTNHQLSQQQAFIFVYFVRQVLAKRKQQLSKMIEAWAPGHSDIISDFGYNEETLTGNVEPTDLLRIYIAICQLESFNGAWMGEDVVGFATRALENQQGVDYGSIASRSIQH